MKVVISGYYGYGNLGDEALLAGMLQGLSGHHLTVLSGAPGVSAALHRVPAVHRYTGALPALLRADALISGGGGLLQDKTSRRSLHYYLGLIQLAKRLGKRVIVYGQSLGPLSAAGERAVAGALAGVAIAVRDRPSQALLAKHGLEAALVADSALTLSRPASAPASGPVLLIPRGGYPEITEALAQLGQQLAAAGLPLAALALQEAADGPELQVLQRRLPALALQRAATPEAVIACCQQARYVVSARLHGLILAAVAGTPYAGIVYDPKVAAFLAETEAPAFGLPVAVAQLAECALAGHSFKPAALAALRARARQGLAWLAAQLS